MESRLARQMGYVEEPRPGLEFMFVRSDIAPQAIQALRDEVGHIETHPSETDQFRTRLFTSVANSFQSRKPIIISPMMVEGKVYPPTVVSLMGNAEGKGKPEMNFTLMDYQAFDLIDFLFPQTEGNPEENEMRKEYKTVLVEHLKKGNRIKLFPSKRLN